MVARARGKRFSSVTSVQVSMCDAHERQFDRIELPSPQMSGRLLPQLGRPIRDLVSLEAADELVPAEHRRPYSKSGGYRPLEEFRLDGTRRSGSRRAGHTPTTCPGSLLTPESHRGRCAAPGQHRGQGHRKLHGVKYPITGVMAFWSVFCAYLLVTAEAQLTTSPQAWYGRCLAGSRAHPSG